MDGARNRTSQVQRQVPHVRNRHGGALPALSSLPKTRRTPRRGRGGLGNDKHRNDHHDELAERRVKRSRWLGELEPENHARSNREKGANGCFRLPRYHRGISGIACNCGLLHRCVHRNSTWRHFERPQEKGILGVRGPATMAAATTAVGGIVAATGGRSLCGISALPRP